jgi:hypothetical protein
VSERNLKRATVLWMVLAVSYMALLAGCTTPQKRYATATQTYTAALNVVSSAREAGQITDAQYAEIEQYRKVAALVLDRMKVAADTGDDQQARTLLRQFSEVIDKMLAARAAAGGNRGTD